MDGELKKKLEGTALAIRGLAMDAVEKAKSGHPGLPLGCAEIGAYLFGKGMRYYAKNPLWMNRDRFILSAGHGSMLLYSLLYLSGFPLELEDIKNFRQLYSRTPGHPEYHPSIGVEATTGPLGQGIGNAVGLALGYKILQAKFNTEDFSLFTNKIFCLAGDGCIMEGASSEASSLAGHLVLDNLVVIYDANNISLDGPLLESCSEDTPARYRSYGWDVYEVDGHDLDAIDTLFAQIAQHQSRPVLIVAHTIIGKGAPHKAGSHKVHGAPLGVEEVSAAKKMLQLPEEPFYVPQEIQDFFCIKEQEQKKNYQAWEALFEAWQKKYPHLFEEFKKMREKEEPRDLEKMVLNLDMETNISGRAASHVVVQKLAEKLPYLYGGSADLSSSDMTFLDHFSLISSKNFLGRNIKYGVREFAMGTIANGLFLTGMFLPFCGTFLVFSDYMRNAIRMAALSSYQVIYQFTHDSIFIGEDGPTHQPIEQLASLRAIPNLQVIRPADSHEVKRAWILALRFRGPTAIILSRQSLATFEETDLPLKEGMARGAYLVKSSTVPSKVTLIATGSELAVALETAKILEEKGISTDIVSFPSWDLLEKQNSSYKQKIFHEGSLKVVIEAGASQGWHKYIGPKGIAICVDRFGASAPAKEIKKSYGFDVPSIVEKILHSI
ncbi:MAG: transketolase [Parachlamydiales bacterium]|nr:transketolase [Parachlamydiales bacterium]